MVHIALPQAAWVDVVEPAEGHDWREAEHFEDEWHQIPVPELELLMGTRYQLTAGDKADNHDLDGALLVPQRHNRLPVSAAAAAHEPVS